MQSRPPYYLHRDRLAVKQRNVVLREALHVPDLHCLVNHAGRDSLGVNGGNSDISVRSAAFQRKRGIEGIEGRVVGTIAADRGVLR